MSGIVLAAMPRVTRRYDHAAAAQQASEIDGNGNISGGSNPNNNNNPHNNNNYYGGGSVSTGAGYIPVVPTDPSVRCVAFKWVRACATYSLRGGAVLHTGSGLHTNRPVIGDLAMAPGTGRYFYEIRVNTASCKIGLCTRSAYATERDLEDCELGQLPATASYRSSGNNNSNNYNTYSKNNNNNHYDVDGPFVAVLDAQTSRVFVNGQERKHLWRLFVATCGGLFSFVVDTDAGVVQLFVNKKYAGMVFDAEAGLKGRTLHPCVSLAGVDMHNHSIGSGNLGAAVCPAHKFDCLY